MPLPGQAITPAPKTSESNDGSFFGIHLPNLGLQQLVGGVTGSLTGLLHAGIGAGEGLYQAATGNPQKALSDFAPVANIGRGFASSLAGTAINIGDVVTLGQMGDAYGKVRSAVGEALGGDEYKPQTLMDQYREGGLLTPIVQNVSNLALGAGALGKLAELGDIGTAGTAAATAGKALDAGYTAEELGAATDAAKAGKAGFREAAISDKTLQDAGTAAAKAEGVSVDPAHAASRAKLINALHDVAHPYRSLFSEVLSPLGRAATEQLGHEEAALPAEGAVAPEGTRSFDQPESATQPAQEPTAPVSAPETAPVAAGAGAPPQPYPVSDGLRDAIEHAANAQHSADPAEMDVAAKTLRDATHAHLLESEPGPTTTVYRGVKPGTVDNSGQFTERLAEAQQHAGPDGTISSVEVPQHVVEQARRTGAEAGDFGSHPGEDAQGKA